MMDAKLKDQELQMGIRDRKLARLVDQISSLQSDLRSKATELRSSKAQLISQRQYIQDMIDKSQLLRAENLGMKEELQEVERLKKENDKQKERIVQLNRYYKERGHLIQRLKTAQDSNKLLQQMLQTVSTHCFPNPPSFPPTTTNSPSNMNSSLFFSKMNSSLNKPLDPTASSFQPNLNPNARSFLPHDISSRDGSEPNEEKVPHMSPTDAAGITGQARRIEKVSSSPGSWMTEQEKKLDRASPRRELQVEMRNSKDKQFRNEMRQKFAEAVNIQELKSPSCWANPVVTTRFVIKSPKKANACWVNVEFDVSVNPVDINSPQWALQVKDQKPPEFRMDGNWDQWLQKAMDPEVQVIQQQVQSNIEQQTIRPPREIETTVKDASPKHQKLPGQQKETQDFSKLEKLADQEELVYMPGSYKYSSSSKPSEYLDFTIGTSITRAIENEVEMMHMAQSPNQCKREPLEESSNARKKTSRSEAESTMNPGYDKMRLSEEESEAENDNKGNSAVSARQLVRRPIQAQKIVQQSMSEPKAEVLVLVPEEDMTHISKPRCQEEMGNFATPASISDSNPIIQKVNTTH